MGQLCCWPATTSHYSRDYRLSSIIQRLLSNVVQSVNLHFFREKKTSSPIMLLHVYSSRRKKPSPPLFLLLLRFNRFTSSKCATTSIILMSVYAQFHKRMYFLLNYF